MSKSSPVRGAREQLDTGWCAGRGVVGDEVNKQLTRCPRGLVGGLGVGGVVNHVGQFSWTQQGTVCCWLGQGATAVAGEGVLIIQNKH